MVQKVVLIVVATETTTQEKNGTEWRIAMTIKRIHVNQHVLRKNLKDGEHEPIFTVKCSNRNHYGHRVKINGPSEVMYPGKQLSCGARAWIETTSPVEVWQEVDNDNTMIGFEP